MSSLADDAAEELVLDDDSQQAAVVVPPPGSRPRRPIHRSSGVWDYFQEDRALGRAQCLVQRSTGTACTCSYRVTSGNSTSTLWRHLLKHHPTQYRAARAIPGVDVDGIVTAVAGLRLGPPVPPSEQKKADLLFTYWLLHGGREVCVLLSCATYYSILLHRPASPQNLP